MHNGWRDLLTYLPGRVIKLSTLMDMAMERGLRIENDVYREDLPDPKPRGRFALAVNYIPDVQVMEARINTLETQVKRLQLELYRDR